MKLNKYNIVFNCLINGNREQITQRANATNQQNAIFEACKIMTLNKPQLIKALNNRFIDTFELLSVARVEKIQ